MNTKIFEQFDVMTDAELSAVEGGGCNWKGAAATVAVGAAGGAIKGAVTTYSWQGAALKAVGYGIKAGVAYGATCRWT
ncbi:Bacteriocin-like peptide J BlpJ [Streptococcus infantarius subsp. infantarius]|nr:Bacteriocin-like peptide J BlpJ [Streptococcus infantarius subsp. infantarius]MCO4541707.1 Bacteriocin-like peptide J BlpJ [Streptococcus infantarius subsp. infantarius]MCO4543861.1 Bacteriocin-like peptide J BlpJ [Streptococcus infantarius subsp. infantarius]MCO4547784.1 Bacteriocin-like peptide J BlpJ [Streptococcus infantarius subsp. infantarius]MCO4548466.1 Bacteriocin-like peptide J BlpJ [Streptococcus infantarius subsp. infantarius]